MPILPARPARHRHVMLAVRHRAAAQRGGRPPRDLPASTSHDADRARVSPPEATARGRGRPSPAAAPAAATLPDYTLDCDEPRIIQNSSYVGCALMMQSYRRDGQDLSQIDANIENWLQSKTSDVKNMSTICIKLHEQRNGAGYPLSFFKNLKKVERFATDLRQEMQNGEVNP